MDRLAHAVARRFLAGWVNTVNSTYWSLSWDKASKWGLEEMADGSPIPKYKTFGEGPEVVQWTMPQLAALLKKVDLVPPDPNIVRSRAKLRGDMTGAEAREALIAASKSYLVDTVEALNQGGYPDKAHSVEKVLAESGRKLVWKRT